MKTSFERVKRIGGASFEIALGVFLLAILLTAWTTRESQADILKNSSIMKSAAALEPLLPVQGTNCMGLTCPSNITVSNDPNQCGAVVDYPAPTPSGDCGTITCNPPPMSFFPVGTTTINCSTTVCTPIFAVASNTIISFNAATPGTTSTPVPVTGLGMGESLVAIDFRPATGQLYGLVTAGTTVRIVTIDTTTGATTAIGSTFTLNGTGFGFDFNPQVDLIRIVSNAEENIRVSPTTGAVITDPNINPAGDVVGAAYSNNFVGVSITTLYTIDSGTDSLNIQNTPNSGTQQLVGALGVDTSFVVGFDIAQCNGGTAYAALNEGGETGFYTVNLQTGAATFIGDIGGSEAPAVQGIAAAIGPNCSFTITVIDTQPPSITCPANVTTVVGATCPPSSGGVVTFPPPVASDNCPGVTTQCVPPSDTVFPVGTTTVTCTATDASGNTATCSFTVSAFNGCLQDEANPGSVVLFNTFTGEYRFCCNGVVVKSGTGVVDRRACNFVITHNTADRRVLIKVSFTTKEGAASVQMPVGQIKCVITDKNITNNTCQCPAVLNGN